MDATSKNGRNIEKWTQHGKMDEHGKMEPTWKNGTNLWIIVWEMNIHESS